MRKIRMPDLIPAYLAKTSDNLRHNNHVDTISHHLIHPLTDMTWCSHGGYSWHNTIQADKQDWIRMTVSTVKDAKAVLDGRNVCSGCKRRYTDLAHAIHTCQDAGLTITMPHITHEQRHLV